MKKFNTPAVWSCAIMLVLFLAAVTFRPLLPIDETRYMTVAWEMRLHEGWLSPLTMNFEPYHHKPPMLFWLINIFWSVFDVSRWAALVPVALSSLCVVLLTIRLGKKLLQPEDYNPLHVAFLILGSVPFLIYNTLVMFDLTLTAFVLSSLLCLLTYAEKRKFRYIVLMAIFIGLGVLTKGPVAYLYIIFPVLLGPVWVPNFSRPVFWYGDCFAGIFLSIFPVALWLVPVLAQADNHFAFWLLWEQTAGRITGNFNEAHIRPFYFYLPLLPALFMPWIFFPSFWRGIKVIAPHSFTIKFLACWAIPVFLSFSLISGKQPHYLVPLLPAVTLLLAQMLKTIPVSVVRLTALVMVGIVFIGQGIASYTFFKNYDLHPVAGYVENHPDHAWAFVRNYHGELGFLARREQPLADIQLDEAGEWFRNNPDGMAVIRYNKEDEVKGLDEIMAMKYRGKNMGIFKMQKNPDVE